MHYKDNVRSHCASRSKSSQEGLRKSGKSTIGHRRHVGHTEDIKSEHTPPHLNTV